MLQYFLKKSVVTICLNLTILILGIFAFPKIAREFIPAIDIPAVAVVYPTTVHNLDTVRHELLEPVEGRLLKSGVIDRIESFYENGHAVLLLFFDWKLKPEECIQRARQTLSSFQPIQGIQKPLFILHRPTMSPIYRLGLSGEPIDRLTEKAEKLKQQLERTSGVAQVRILGGVKKNTLLQFELSDLARFNVQPKTLLEQMTQKWGFRSLLFDSRGAHELTLNFSQSDDFLNLDIPNVSQKLVPLRFVAKKFSQSPAAEVLNKSGDATLILEIIKSPGSDAVKLTEQVQANVDEFLKGNSVIQSTMIYNEAEKIIESQAGVFSNFLTGIVLNSLVLMIFLGSLTGVVVASSIFPTTILGTLFILKQADISLNIFSLNGFSLAAGMITDASTVLLESIMRRFQNGEEIEEASLKGTKDILIGVITGTLSSAAVMLPICLQSGVSSKLFSDLGYTLVITQLLSLVTVFTFVPWLCFKMIRKNAKQPHLIASLYSGSSFIVNKFIAISNSAFQKATINQSFQYGFPSIIAVLCLGSLFFLPSSELLPQVKANTYSLSIPIHRVQLAHRKEALIEKMTELLKKENSIDWAVTNVDQDSLLSTFKAKSEFDTTSFTKRVAEIFSISHPHVLIFPLGPTPPTEPMNYHGYYYLSSAIPSLVRQQIIDDFCRKPGVVDCESSRHYKSPKVSLTNQDVRMKRGQTNPLETALQAALQIHAVSLNDLADLNIEERIQLKTFGDFPLTESAYLLPQSGHVVTQMGHFYQKHLSWENLTEFRMNLQNYEPLYFKLEGITLGSAMTLMEELQRKYEVKAENIQGMGAIMNMKETFGKMSVALMISLVLTILILLLQFKSGVQTAIIMSSIPLSIGGAVLGLLLLRETVNISVMVGFILLGGIVVNNGILLLEAINQGLDGGQKLDQAIQQAVAQRTRPILMTSVSAIAGMMPTLLFESEGQELYRGMAIVNIFGMAFGTVLTLMVIPIICWIFLRRKYA